MRKQKRWFRHRNRNTAIDEITNSVKPGDGGIYLLHGVTGSGKTEVFMQTVENVINMGKSAIMLVPKYRLHRRWFQDLCRDSAAELLFFTAVCPPVKGYDQWKKIRDGEADIVIGARSAIFTPLKISEL